MEAPAVSPSLAQLPNALTVARLALIPVFVLLMVRAGHRPSWPAGVVFGIAGVTDQVDGFLARRWHVESRFGKLAPSQCRSRGSRMRSRSRGSP